MQHRTCHRCLQSRMAKDLKAKNPKLLVMKLYCKLLSGEFKKIDPQYWRLILLIYRKPLRELHGKTNLLQYLSTASFPWEMFVEADGTSKKAREDFVEVYNRARDELKNQRTSLTTIRGKNSVGVRSGEGSSGYDLPTHRAEGKVELLHGQTTQVCPFRPLSCVLLF